jgi:hypothetical protein
MPGGPIGGAGGWGIGEAMISSAWSLISSARMYSAAAARTIMIAVCGSTTLIPGPTWAEAICMADLEALEGRLFALGVGSPGRGRR